jgi:hypothetical protein
MGLTLAKIGNNFVLLPSGRGLREAKVKILDTRPRHGGDQTGDRAVEQDGGSPRAFRQMAAPDEARDILSLEPEN